MPPSSIVEHQRSGAPHVRAPLSPLKRWLLVIAGTICTALGLIGIVLPILPTTPFLLLAAASYARGSERFYNWLLGNPLFGSYIRNYLDGNGIPLISKVVTLVLLWSTILATIIVFVHLLVVRILLIGIASGVTVHILTIKTFHAPGKKHGSTGSK